jgi:hypothetical protein
MAEKKRRIGDALAPSQRNKLEGMLGERREDVKDPGRHDAMTSKRYDALETRRHDAKTAKRKATIYLTPPTMKALKILSAETDEPMSDLVEEALGLLFQEYRGDKE